MMYTVTIQFIPLLMCTADGIMNKIVMLLKAIVSFLLLSSS